MKIMLCVIDNVGGYAGEAPWQAVEIDGIGVAGSQMPEEPHQILAFNKPCRTREMTFAQFQCLGEEISSLQLSALKILRRIDSAVAQEKRPVLSTYQGIELRC